MAAFEYRQAEEIRAVFRRHQVRYLFIGFPLCHIDDIIANKSATNRQKDRETLPRLRAFREFWMGQRGKV